jgi:hypothetical protein|tara:strand:- start:1648 stop:1923 length:276 start_codon:yes stop_codon:yes gene_type:complete
MDEYGVKELVACIIEQAVHDRRKAVTERLIDDKCNPIQPLGCRQAEMVVNLKPFFHVPGGLEIAADVAGFGLPIEEIRRISNEPYVRRKKG